MAAVQQAPAADVSEEAKEPDAFFSPLEGAEEQARAHANER
jgi:hypothetical protein